MGGTLLTLSEYRMSRSRRYYRQAAAPATAAARSQGGSIRPAGWIDLGSLGPDAIFDAAVPVARLGACVAFGYDPSGVHTSPDQHVLGALLRQHQGGSWVAGIVGISGDLQHGIRA